MITEDTLKQVLGSQLSGSSEEQLQALLTTATNLATVQPGTIDYIKLLSPVRRLRAYYHTCIYSVQW